MTTSRELDRVLAKYLEDGPTELPDRSYDEVRTIVDTTRQRAVIGPWRTPSMLNMARVAVIGAIVLTLSIGAYLVPRQSGAGGIQPSPSPGASAAASPSGPLSTLPGQYDPNYSPAPLAAGAYTFTNPTFINAQSLTATVPDGWSTSQGLLSKHVGEPGYVAFTPWVVTHVFADSCHWAEAAPSVVSGGTSVDDLVNVMSTRTDRTATAPVDVTIGGFPGKQIVLTNPTPIDVTTCTHGFIRYWPDAGPNFNGGFCCDPAGNTDVVDVVNVAGHRMVLVARHYPGSSEADLAELQSIVDSIQIVPLPAPSSPSAGTSASPTS